MNMYTAPSLLGQRMSQGSTAFTWFLRVGDMTIRLGYLRPLDATRWSIVIGSGTLKSGSVKGYRKQMAANAAQRWLVEQAELTLKLAGSRAA